MGVYNYIKPVLKGVVILLDIIFYPIYFIWYLPWKELDKRNTQRTTIEFISENEVLAKPVATSYHLQVKQRQVDVSNIYELFKIAARKYSSQPCSGVRKVLSEKMEKDAKGTVV